MSAVARYSTAMRGGGRHGHRIGAELGLLALAWPLLAAAADPPIPRTQPDPNRATGLTVSASHEAAPIATSETPRGFLIYLKDGGEPIVVARYVEENGEIRFEKYGGRVGIPTYEIFRIVPDVPDRSAALPLPAPPPGGGDAPRAADADLYVTLRGGGDLKATAVTAEGERVRVSVPDGSFTVPRSDILGVVRVPQGLDTPEAWISVVMTGRAEDVPARTEATPTSDGRVDPPAVEPARTEPERPAPAATAPSGPRIPYPSSDRPHFVRFASGQLMRLDGFWIEDGQLRFQRLGGMIGVALGEVLRLIPEEIAPVKGRTQVRFAKRLAPDLIEVRVRSGLQRVRLLGLTPTDGTRTAESPWRHLEEGTIVYLEFDRQRYDAQGNWLAYVFLPNHRMLNAELIRLGLARPLVDGHNVRYLDLFHELTTGDLPDGAAAASRTN
ncbi:MAG: hypothetical protein ACRELA_03205 [Candidatus Rokuibacteriota bacterium]